MFGEFAYLTSLRYFKETLEGLNWHFFLNREHKRNRRSTAPGVGNTSNGEHAYFARKASAFSYDEE